MKRYIRSAEDLSSDDSLKIAKMSIDPKELARLANDEDARVRRIVAENPNTSAKTLAQLANDKDMYVRSYVAKNPNTPTNALAQLANDEDTYVKGFVAERPNIPAAVLAQLANDEDMRWCLAANPSIPVDILIQLANDRDKYVRYRVAKNPSTPDDVLAQLANDEIYLVRQGVAKNSSTPADVLAQLANDEDEDVRQAAANNPNTPADSVKTQKTSQTRDWQAFLSELEKECEDGDPLYKQDPAGEELLELCYEVELEMPFWLEPSVQSGQGGIWIYDTKTDETLVGNIDYAHFNYTVVDMAFESDSANEFKQKYKTYLLSLTK